LYSDADKRPGQTDDRGVYLSTRDGHLVYLLDPRPEDFDPVRTARTLAHEHRYVGNFGPYSVAQHAVNVAETVESLLWDFTGDDEDDKRVCRRALAGLHHDDVEYITGDLPQPVKSLFPEFKAFERSFEPAIERRYAIDLNDEIIKEADRIVFCAEIRVLVPAHAQSAYAPYGDPAYRIGLQPQWREIVPWSADEAFARYMETHDRLTARAGL
jgi:5'-deoxynucleotidase YfbR-like HD superfamily hydrolase